MIDRFKVMSGLMVLIAVFLVTVGFNYLKIDLDLNSNQGKSSLIFESDNDWDNDGLVNREESYWNTDPNNPDTDGDGYLDGEEVTSGHDPLIPAPDDLIPTEANLTQKMSALALAGLYEGSLKQGSSEYKKSLDQLASVIVGDAIKNLVVDISKINLIIVSPSKSNQEIYINNISKPLEDVIEILASQMKNFEKNLNTIGQNGFKDTGLVEEFGQLSFQYQKTFETLSEVSVPINWEQTHLSLMKFVGNLSEISQVVAQGKNDPVKATVALDQLFLQWEILPDLVEVFVNKIASDNLNTKNTIFEK